MIRTLLGIVLGLVAAGLAIFGVESLGHWLHPIPADIDWQDRVAVTALVESLPTQALLIVLAAWAAGALVGGFVAGSVSALHKRGAALTVGFVVLVMVVINIAMIPHPMWMAAAGVLVPLPFAWLGGRWAL